MNASEFVELLDEVLFVLLFAAVALHAVRSPSRASVDTVLLFGAVVLILAVDPGAQLLGLEGTPAPIMTIFVILAALPYLLIRLVADFSEPRPWVPPAAAAIVVLLGLLIVATGATLPGWLLLLNITWFLVAGAYTGLAFMREAGRSTGLTRRRMEAVAVGSVLLMSAIVVALVGALLPPFGEPSVLAARLVGLGAGVAYFLGFAPPPVLRRIWQEPEIRAFLEHAAALPRLPETAAAVLALERGAANALGAPRATIGLADADGGRLRYLSREGDVIETGHDEFIGGRSFASQKPIFSRDAVRDDPANAETYRRVRANAVLAAPITAGESRLGVLCVYSARAPLFADDDLRLVRLLANQAAVVLESRALIDEAAGVRAREEMTRLKDDFLSAAAHDLRTPLTILLGQAELLERRASRDPQAPVDLARVERIAREARRLRTLVQDLLDVSRVEEGRLVSSLESVDLVEIATDVCARHASEHGDCLLQTDGPVLGSYDRTRIVQMLDNLIENGRKYSRSGAPVTVRVWREADEARMSVRDEGIGIAAADLPHIFDRFYRATNADDRRQSGSLGLGLFICRGIAEQHGGRIWAESAPQHGATFHVALPAPPAAAQAAPPTVEAEAGAPQPPTVGSSGRGQPGGSLGPERPLAHG